jgi:hypothetical protein
MKAAMMPFEMINVSAKSIVISSSPAVQPLDSL